jgi:tetratricopeptide (TPR) repeat protein
MPYQPQHLSDLQDIITLVEAKKIHGPNNALIKFELYLGTIQSIGPYDKTHWRRNWRKSVWEFGALFEKINPTEFVQKIEKTKGNNLSCEEVIDFIHSEISCNFHSDDEGKVILEKMITKYPYNPEFRHSLGHIYRVEKKYQEAIAQYSLALKIEPADNDYLSARFNCEEDYLNECIAEGSYEDAENYISKIFEEEIYKKNSVTFHNSLIDFSRRIQDHKIFKKGLDRAEREFQKNMRKELNNERRRIIEILGFFSAIVAFILSTVSVAKNFSFLEATYFIISLGLILILFLIAISVLFSSKKKKERFYNKANFWILTISLVMILVYIILSEQLAEIVNKLPL